MVYGHYNQPCYAIEKVQRLYIFICFNFNTNAELAIKKTITSYTQLLPSKCSLVGRYNRIILAIDISVQEHASLMTLIYVHYGVIKINRRAINGRYNSS